MPSEKILAMKQEIVAGLAEEMKSAETMVFADYLGLSVAQDTELRKELREAGVTYKVIKNTLASRAVVDAGLPELKDLFVGPTALAYSTDDAVAPAKILKKFADKFSLLEIKGGASEGKVVELSYIEKLSSIPDLPVLYAKVVGGLVSPIAALPMLLSAISTKMEEAGAETAADVYIGAAEAASESEDAEETEEVAETAEVAETPEVEELAETAEPVEEPAEAEEVESTEVEESADEADTSEEA